MALNDLELSVMAFPQNWNHTSQQLSVNLLLLPVGNPLLPLGTGPQFAGTTIVLSAVILKGLDSLPSTATPAAIPSSSSSPAIGRLTTRSDRAIVPSRLLTAAG